MKLKQYKQTGFTLVELLIVIVVIAILATISVVAYNGIQNRASDTAVQADLRNYAAKVMEFQALNDRYPAGSGAAPGTAQNPVEGIPRFRLARGAYSPTHHNFYYCATDDEFVVGAVSKSGNMFYYSSEGGLDEYAGVWGGSSENCPGMIGFATGWTSSYAYNYLTGTWASWTQ